MTDATISLNTAEKIAVTRFLNELRPIYVEEQLTGFSTSHADAITVTGPTFYKGGNRITLRGVSLAEAGNAWQGTRDSWARLQNDTIWPNVNVVRVPIHTQHFRGQEGSAYAGQAYVDNVLVPIVNSILATGRYVIVDWHPIDDYTDSIIEASYGFWEMVAPLYRNNPKVIFELYNEPKGDGGGNLINSTNGGYDHSLNNWLYFKSKVQPLLDYVRKKAPSNHIIVGSPSWSTRIRYAGTHPFTGGNLSYTFHQYPNHGRELGKKLQDLMELDMPRDIPIFFTEFGFETLAIGSGGDNVINIDNNPDYPDVFKRFLLDRPNISWTAWCWDYEARPAMLADSQSWGNLPGTGDAMKAWVQTLFAAAVDYTPLDTPVSLSDYTNLPNLVWAIDAHRSTITEVNGKISQINAFVGSGNIVQSDAAKRLTLTANAIDGEKGITCEGGYTPKFMTFSAPYLTNQPLLTFFFVLAPKVDVGNATVFSTSDGSGSLVELVHKGDGKVMVIVSGNGNIKYTTAPIAINDDTPTLIILTIDFPKQTLTLEVNNQEILVNGGFGTKVFGASVSGSLGGNSEGSAVFNGNIGIIGVATGIIEYRYKKALKDYMVANRV